ncbi:MAG TPA: N-acetylmuramoyl-L-alanine amidase [Defluviitaleaceae bacterium]|nr:N-acetylmuramoyl-L-alanine amidase [Defluviitaleaceae bacterium]
MNIIQNLVPQSKFNIKCPYTMNPEFIVVHNTYNDASARSEVAYMINNNNQTSYHYAIDDKEIIQAIPENRNAWHAGDGNGSGNRKGIGIEICYSKSGGSKFIAAEKLAAKFIAFKLNEKGWGIDKVKKHQDFSGKYCPHRTLDMGWQRFLNMVKDELDKLKTPVHPINTNIVKASYKGRQFNFDGFMKDNTNYVQIRQVLEALGYRVVWDNASKTVLIYDK